MGERNQAALMAHLRDAKDLSAVELGDIVRMCRLWTTFKEDTLRLTLDIKDMPEIRKAILAALEQVGADRKVGRAPATARERERERESWRRVYS